MRKTRRFILVSIFDLLNQIRHDRSVNGSQHLDAVLHVVRGTRVLIQLEDVVFHLNDNVSNVTVLDIVLGQFVIREFDVLDLCYQSHELDSIYSLLDVLIITIFLRIEYCYRIKHALCGSDRQLDQNIVQYVQEHKPVFVRRLEVYFLTGEHLAHCR